MIELMAPATIRSQVSCTCKKIQQHLSASLQAIHLFGSAVDSGLKPQSDIDLLVTVSEPLDGLVRRQLMLDLLDLSVPPGTDKILRALEVTVVCHNEVSPWRYPAKRQMQFGEWLREDLTQGIFEPAKVDVDLTILLRKIRAHSIPLLGPSADTLFDPVPSADFFKALKDTLKLWNSPEDWEGEERNVVLTLARIWYSAATGQIASKDSAAAWLLKQLPATHQPILYKALQAYKTGDEDHLSEHSIDTADFIHFAKSMINSLLR